MFFPQSHGMPRKHREGQDPKKIDYVANYNPKVFHSEFTPGFPMMFGRWSGGNFSGVNSLLNFRWVYINIELIVTYLVGVHTDTPSIP